MQLSQLWLACALASSIAMTGCGGNSSNNGPSAPAKQDETPVTDAPEAESPEAPGDDTPVTDTPVTDTPVTPAPPVTEEPEVPDPVVTTSFNVTVIAPNLRADNSVQPVAVFSAQSNSLAPENFAVTVVDTSGKVVEVVELTSDNLIRNDDGSWTIVLPGNPQLNCLVVVDLNKPIVITPQQPLPPEVIFAPTVAAELEVSIESTAAYQAFLDLLADDQSFADLGFDITDAESLALVEQLLAQIQETYARLIDSGSFDPQAFSSVDDVLARIEAQVATIVEQEIASSQNTSDSQLADALAASQSLYEFEGQLPDSPAYAKLNETEEVRFNLTGSSFEIERYQDNDGNLLLTADGWEQLADWVKTEAQDNGSVIITDENIAAFKEQYSAARAVDLNGRNISDFLSIDPDTQLTGFMMKSGDIFPEGAVAYQLTEGTVLNDSAKLFCNDPNDCELLLITSYDFLLPETPAEPGDEATSELTPANLFEEQLVQAEAATSVAELTAFSIGRSFSGPETTEVVAEVVADQTVKFHQITATFETDLEVPDFTLTELASGSWSFRALDGLEDGQQVLTFELPAVVRDALEKNIPPTAPPFAQERVLDNYPEGTLYLIAEYNGRLVPGSYTPAGTNIATSGYVFNETAGEAIVTSFDEVQLGDLPLIRSLADSVQNGFFFRPAQALLCEPVSFRRNLISQRTFTIVNDYCRALQRSALEAVTKFDGDLTVPEVIRNAEVEEFIRPEQVSGQSWYYGLPFDPRRVQQLTFNIDGSLSVAEVVADGTQETGITGSWTLENGKLNVVANIPATGDDDEAFTLTRIIELLVSTEVAVEDVQTEVFFFHELLSNSAEEGDEGEDELLVPAIGSPSLNGLREFQSRLNSLIPQ